MGRGLSIILFVIVAAVVVLSLGLILINAPQKVLEPYRYPLKFFLGEMLETACTQWREEAENIYRNPEYTTPLERFQANWNYYNNRGIRAYGNFIKIREVCSLYSNIVGGKGMFFCLKHCGIGRYISDQRIKICLCNERTIIKQDVNEDCGGCPELIIP